ncbi:MAG: VOC family protein [Thermodesulfobacteriota bacterium]
MEVVLDHVVVAVADLAGATRAYGSLVGRAPSWRGAHPTLGTRNALFRLDAGPYLELLAADVPGAPPAELVTAALRGRAERPLMLALGVPDVDAAVAAARARGLAVSDPAGGEGVDDGSGLRRTWRSALLDRAGVRGLRIMLLTHGAPADALPVAPPRAAAGSVAAAIDHVVVFTQDLGASLALWTSVLGAGVAWPEKDFPERGTRNAGLDLGGVVLELIQRTDRAPSARGDVLWGIAYRVGDVDAALARLRADGTETSEARQGLAPGTRVANVRWQRTPTLLIGPA